MGKKRLNPGNALIPSATGPKTENGKAISSRNAVKFGLTGRGGLLPGEDPVAFEAFQKAIREEYDPSGPSESFLVDRVADLMWRLRRASRIQTAILAKEMAEFEEARSTFSFGPGTGDANPEEADCEPTDGGLEIEAYRKSLAREDVDPIGIAFVRDARGADAISRIDRHESNLDRQLQRNLAILERLRRLRAGEKLPAPIAGEITIVAGCDRLNESVIFDGTVDPSEDLGSEEIELRAGESTASVASEETLPESATPSHALPFESSSADVTVPVAPLAENPAVESTIAVGSPSHDGTRAEIETTSMTSAVVPVEKGSSDTRLIENSSGTLGRHRAAGVLGMFDRHTREFFSKKAPG